MLQKTLYNLGILLRNKQIFSELEFLKKSQYWKREQLVDYQTSKCRELLEFAYENSKYYKNLFDKNNIRPQDFNGIEDLKKFPILEKCELKKYKDDIQIKRGFDKLFYSETSGSSGEPLIFYRDAKWDAGHRAAIFRGYSWHGVNYWDRNGYFWGYNLENNQKNKVKILDLLQNRFRVFSYEDKELNKFIRKMKKAKYIEGYSSMIYQVSKIINSSENKQYKFKKLKMIKGTSEKIFENYKVEAKKAFGLPIISEYGAAEAGIIAFECPCGNMHIAMENVIVESKNGEAIITNLLSKSFPIIRYKLGDYIELDMETKCECNMEHGIVKSVLGRVGSVIYGKKNIYPTLTLYYIFKNLAAQDIVINYQAIQNTKETLDIYIEKELTDKERDKLKKEIIKYFKDDVECEVHEKSEIKRDKGKLKDFISKV